MKCHICKKETDFKCESCEEPICDKCCIPFTIHNQCTDTICKDCDDNNTMMRAETKHEESLQEKQIQKIKDERNRKARSRYHSPEQVEKRRQKKMKLQEEAFEKFKKRNKDVKNIMKKFGF